MSEKYFDPGHKRAAKVEQLFTHIAGRYDLINDLQSLGLHRLWKQRLIRLARVKPGQRALDVCCGTGDIALALAKQGAQTIGLDFSQDMLQVAEAKARKLELRPTSPDPAALTSVLAFIQGDAMQLPFSPDSFDIVSVGYGLRNLASWEKGLREMHRVARRGGRLLVLDFGKPSNPLWRAIYFGYLRFFVPWFGRIFCGNAAAYSYILESLVNYPAQEGLAAVMREIGLAQVCVINLMGGAMSINFGIKEK